jgi:transcriptional regulator with XRE-family HTH domain
MNQPRDESWTPSGSGKAPYPFQPSYNAADAPSTPPRTLGDRLRMARYAANLTQEELASGNFSKSYISAVERGKMTPSIPALRFLAARLDVSLAYLLGEDFPNQEQPPAEVASLEPASSQEPSLEDQLAQCFEDTEHLLTRGDPDAALKRLGAQPPPDLNTAQQARWNWLYAWTLAQQHREQEANAVLEQGLRAAHESQDLITQGHLHFTFANANVNRSEDTAVEQAYQEAIRCFEQTSSKQIVCVHEQYGAFLAARGRYQEAYEQISRAQAASTRSDGNR